MNFTERGAGPPTYRVSDFFFSTVLNTDQKSLVDRNYIYLSKNNIATEDQHFYSFEYSYQGIYFDIGK